MIKKDETRYRIIRDPMTGRITGVPCERGDSPKQIAIAVVICLIAIGAGVLFGHFITAITTPKG